MIRALWIQLRKRFIRKLAGQMGICLNCALFVDEKRGPSIAYADKYGGMCEKLEFDLNIKSSKNR